MRRHVGTVVLVVAALFFGWLLFRDRGGVSDAERAQRKDLVFPSWRRDRITRVALRTDAGEVVLDRDPIKNTWSLHGMSAGADAARADILLGELEHAVALRRVDDAVASGLASPRVRGEITMGELSYTFALGADAKPPEGAAYFRVTGLSGAAGAAGKSGPGEPVVVVERRLVAVLLAPLEELRDKALVKVSGTELSELVFAPAKGPAFSLVRDGKTRFRLGLGGPYAARVPVEATLSALADLRAERFLGAREGEAATREATLVLALREAPGSTETTLAFGGPCPGSPADVVVALRGSAPIHACVPAGVVGVLSRSSAAYEDRQVFFTRADEVEEVTVRSASGETLDLARKGSGFRLRAPESRDLDEDASDSVTTWLRTLLGVRGEVATAEPALAKPELVSTVEVHLGAVTETVRVARGTDGRLFATRGDGREVACAPETARVFLPPRAVTRGAALVASARARTVRGFELFCDGLSQRVVHKDGFRFVPPEPFELDPALAAGAASALLGARAERWVSDTRTPSFPLSTTCGARVSFEDDAGPRDLTFELGPNAEGPVYGSIAGESAVFEAPRALVDLVRRPLATRASFVVDPARARSVTIQRGLGLTHVAIDSPLDKVDAGPGGATVGDALAALRPLFVVRRGAFGPTEAGGDPVTVDIALSPGDAGPRRTRIRFGREFSSAEGKLVYAERDGVPFVFAVRSELASPFRAAVPAVPPQTPR